MVSRSRRLRVVVMTGIYPPEIGGPATHSAELRAEFLRRGHSVTVLTFADVRERTIDEGVIRWPRGKPWLSRHTSIVRWLVKNRRSFDVVYATGLHPSAVLGARIARRPVVVKVVGDSAWERSRRQGRTGAGFEEFQSPGSPMGLSVRAMQWVRNRALRGATRIVAPSRYLADVIQGWIGPEHDVVVIHNGVRAGSRPALDRTPGSDRIVRAVSVGRLVPHKQIDVLIRAVAEVPGVFLDVIGEGPSRAELERLSSELGVDERVSFVGALDHDQVMERLAEADVLVSASSYEGLPHVAIEALANGTPVLAPPVGGMTEVIEHGRNGLLVETPLPGSFVESLTRLQEDPNLRAGLAAAAAADSSRWSFVRCADAIESLLAGLVHGRPRVVFLGKTLLPPVPSDDLLRKFAILARHLDAVLVNVGPSGPRRNLGVRAVVLPQVKPGFLGGLLYYGLAPLAALWLGRNGGAIVCQSPYEAAGAILLRRLMLPSRRPRVVVEVHGDWGTAPRLYGSPARKLISPLSDRIAVWALRRADRVRVIGSYTEALVRDAGYTGETDRFPAFSDFSYFLADPVVALPAEPRVAFVGVFERYKAVDVLIEAWPLVVEALPTARLTMAGSGSLVDEVRERVSALDVQDSVVLLGKIPRSQIKGLLDDSSCLVLPSRSEGLGLVLLEAAARGRAAVASDVGGIPEVVEDGRTGSLVPPEDPERLAEALVGLLRDPAALESWGKEARRRIETRDPLEEFEAGTRRLAAWVGSSDV